MGCNKNKVRRLWEQDPHCHWCGKITAISNRMDGKPTADMATYDHIFTRLDQRRFQVSNKGVLACYDCNTTRHGWKPDDPRLTRLSFAEQSAQQSQPAKWHPEQVRPKLPMTAEETQSFVTDNLTRHRHEIHEEHVKEQRFQKWTRICAKAVTGMDAQQWKVQRALPPKQKEGAIFVTDPKTGRRFGVTIGVPSSSMPQASYHVEYVTDPITRRRYKLTIVSPRVVRSEQVTSSGATRSG